MSEQLPVNDHEPKPLSRELAEQYADKLAALADQIPGVSYTTETVLAETKGERQLLGKWDHSLVVMESQTPIGLVIGYERQAEGNEQYPENTLYISELAVDEGYRKRGIAQHLLTRFIQKTSQRGFLHIPGQLNYSVQTNSEDWNQHVINLYKSFGFRERARKHYLNRTDIVLGVQAQDTTISY